MQLTTGSPRGERPGHNHPPITDRTPPVSLNFYSTFAGIGGFDLGFERAGMRCLGQSELIGHRRSILAREWPDATQQGDICDVTGDSIGDPDLISGGFPCKDLSIAKGHRLGLAGARSGLFYEFTRLVGEYLRLVDHARPRWLVLENTPGLLKSNGGRDMDAVVTGLEDLGYGWAYRVVDGGLFGTPQRRERVVVVAHRGGDPRPAWAVLGDEGAGPEAARPYRVGGGSSGPRPVGDPADTHGAVIWRKSSRARKKLSEGGYETWVPATHANTLTGFDGGRADRQTHLIAQDGRLRTLTLTEWERLSGFPDGWTEGMPETERFGTLGDCFHPGTAEWLGQRIMAVHGALAAHPRIFDAVPGFAAAAVEEQLALFA